MMKNKFLVGVSTLGLAALLLTGCAKMPQVEIDQANTAVENAKTAGAEMYVQEDFIALQDSMKAAMESIETQKSKFFKKYDEAKVKLAGVTQYAQELVTKTDARKEELKNEIGAAIAQITSLNEDNKKLVAEAPKGKEGASALLAISDEINAIDASVIEANTMLQNGELMPVLTKVKATKIKANSINMELKDVIAKVQAKKKPVKSAKKK
ncbi:MAG: hypothetical protein K9H64_03625 [Bacteroidales bacterium]|nr:hypothetical protein [Bacteroidales bacterium]